MMRWSPTSRVFSMEPEGITRACPSVPLINRNMRMTHIQAMISRWMRCRRERVSTGLLFSGLLDFIVHLQSHCTLYIVLVHFSAHAKGQELRRAGRYDVSGRFALGDVRDDGARTHV